MLDALVSQLPGVELKDNGQIFVNGRFVESLLLNGRDFFGKDNKLMMDNLGACYTRRGYSDNAFNTTDVVWNARLSYTAFKGSWVFMLDGFDILNQLSNVTYGVNAQARTVTYTNVLPRYAMLHVQYKFNIQPKKR